MVGPSHISRIFRPGKAPLPQPFSVDLIPRSRLHLKQSSSPRGTIHCISKETRIEVRRSCLPYKIQQSICLVKRACRHSYSPITPYPRWKSQGPLCPSGHLSCCGVGSFLLHKSVMLSSPISMVNCQVRPPHFRPAFSIRCKTEITLSFGLPLFRKHFSRKPLLERHSTLKFLLNTSLCVMMTSTELINLVWLSWAVVCFKVLEFY